MSLLCLASCHFEYVKPKVSSCLISGRVSHLMRETAVCLHGNLTQSRSTKCFKCNDSAWLCVHCNINSFVQILWEPTESSAAACARRLWKRPVGVHRGLRQRPLTTDSRRVSPPTRALMQLNQGSTSLQLLPCSLPPSHHPTHLVFFSPPQWLFSFHTESKLYLNEKGIF